MRRLLAVLMAVALAMLPRGAMVTHAHADAVRGDVARVGAAVENEAPCHHQAGHQASQHTASVTGHGDTSAHEHRHAHATGSHASAHDADVVADTDSDTTMHALDVHQHGGGKPCPHCGPSCHCVGGCATACGGPMLSAAAGLPVRVADSATLSPGDVTMPRARQIRPPPPPPRA